MPFEATVLYVLIASPGDVTEQRDAMERAVHGWNSSGNAEARKVVLLPLRWEVDALPLMYRGDGQQVINQSLVKKADLVFALFHTSLGSPTARKPSGTVEELNEARKRGAKV